METIAGKKASEILARFGAVLPSFEQYELIRAQRARDVLRETLTDPILQDRLCAELEMYRKGYPLRGEYPLWALQLAWVIRNPEGRYGTRERAFIYDGACQLHAEAVCSDGGQDFARYLTQEKVVVLSRIARDLLRDRLALPVAH